MSNERDDNLFLTFSRKRQRTLIYKDVLRALGEPECYRFLINEDNNQLAMQVCAFGDSGFHIAKYDMPTDQSYEVSSAEMMELIWELCDWNPELSYRVPGILCPDIHVVIFDLNQAETTADTVFEE